MPKNQHYPTDQQHHQFDPYHAQANGLLSGDGQWLVDNFLFVDFDGVLHSHEVGPYENHLQEFRAGTLSPEGFIKAVEATTSCGARLFTHADRLAQFAQQVNAGIVISTSWRLYFSMTELRQLLSPAFCSRIVGFMSNADEPEARFVLPGIRGILALKWLTQADALHRPWVAFDDQPSLYEGVSRNLVAPTPALGLQEDDYYLAHARLVTQEARLRSKDFDVWCAYRDGLLAP